MSSHHFVKEGQEPALLIVEPLSSELIGPFLEWSPYVIIADTIIDDIMRWGIKIDAVITTDKDQDFLLKKISTQGPVEIVKHSATENLLKAGIDFLVDQKQQAVTIVVDAGEKIFDELLRVNPDIRVVLITPHLKWSLISSTFKKWLPEKATLRVKSLNINDIVYAGVTENETGLLLADKDGTVTLQSEKAFWVGELLI